MKAEEEATAASAKKKLAATPSLFVEPEDEGAVPAEVAGHTSKSAKISSSKEGGDIDVVKGFKQEPEYSLTKADSCMTQGLSPAISTIPIPPAPTPIQITIRQTVITSGPYAGLLSAGKRRRDDPVNPFAPTKKQHCQSEGLISS